jgi:hypothetical protein
VVGAVGGAGVVGSWGGNDGTGRSTNPPLAARDLLGRTTQAEQPSQAVHLFYLRPIALDNRSGGWPAHGRVPTTAVSSALLRAHKRFPPRAPRWVNNPLHRTNAFEPDSQRD